MTAYKEILENIKSNKVNYGNDLTGVCYINKAKMKIKADGELQFFSSFEQMARNINKFIKTGY